MAAPHAALPSRNAEAGTLRRRSTGDPAVPPRKGDRHVGHGPGGSGYPADAPGTVAGDDLDEVFTRLLTSHRVRERFTAV
ncbi:hypothetical protein Aglo01_34810 [Actinokineospora globicatena]|nr:hypothetical protein Aglo01_34810 [Actinokineospora globicatena]GLW86590.1 hypothetical protein Aglo02_42290 [Actinokineospora globicatena]